MVFLIPLLLTNLSTESVGESQETVYYNALMNTVRIHHISPYTTQYGTTGDDQIMGSGIVLDNGLILSCYHIFDDYAAGQIRIYRFKVSATEVRQGDQVSIVAFDKEHDLLLLQVTPPFSEPSVKVAVMEPIIGDDTIITGHTSLRVTRLRLYRYLEGPEGIMVTPVFRGDSGGGVFNQDGELVGIIQRILAIRNPILQDTLYGYAANLDTIKEFLNDRPRKN